MNVGKWLTGICLISSLVACSDDDERDDSVLDMNVLVGKNWYYNGWAGEKEGFGQADLFEGVRFEKGGKLKGVDFGGRREYTVGKWVSEENKILLMYPDDTTTWSVQHSGEDYIQTLVNYQGTRKYTTQPGYLGELTADAFLVNEYTSGNQLRTYVDADVRGNLNMKEGNLLLSGGRVIALEPHGYYWDTKTTGRMDFDGRDQEVRFYLRIGSEQLKLRDSLYNENLPSRIPAELALETNCQDGGLRVSWNPYPADKIYYKIEIFSRDMNLKKPFFVSRIQPAGTGELFVKATTAGELNEMGQLQAGETYALRLTALLYEPGIDPLNDQYGYANVQAIARFTELFIWK